MSKDQWTAAHERIKENLESKGIVREPTEEEIREEIAAEQDRLAG